MNKKEIETFSNNYTRQLKIKRELLKIKKRIEELEQTKELQEYFLLKSEIDNCKGYSFEGIDELSDDEILDRAINNIQDEDTANIFVCMKQEKNKTTFKNLSSELLYVIDNNDLDLFDENNITVYPSKSSNPDEFFNNMKREYYVRIASYGSQTCAHEYALRRSHTFRRKND